MEHSASRRVSRRTMSLVRCAAAIVLVALAMSMAPGAAQAASYLVIVIETPDHHLGDGPGNEGTAFQKTFVVGRPLPHPELVLDITGPYYEDPPKVSLNGSYLGSLGPFFPPIDPADPLWQFNGDGSHDYNGTFVVRLPASPLLIGENTFRIEGLPDDNFVFGDVRIEDHWVMLGVIVEGTVSDGHGHEVEDARLTLYHDAETTPLATVATAADGSYELEPDELVVGEKYRVTAELESEDHMLVMKEKGAVVSFSRDFIYDDTDSLRLDFECSKDASFAAASIDKANLENCASVWHWLQRNRQVAQEIGRDLTSPLTVHVFSTEEDGTGAWYEQSENAISLGRHTMDDDTHEAGGGAPDDAYPAPWDFRKNRETHEFGHAMMNVVMGGMDVAGPDIANHAGYANGDTGDSLSEGFAEFWCMVADESAAMSGEPDKYDEWGYLTGANARMAWSPVRPAAPLAKPTDYTSEEFAAAGLLRTLQGVLGGGQTGFLKIADNLPSGGNLTDFRDALVASGVAAATIDPVFFSFGFFADTDGDWTHDAGEPVGAGNGTSCKLLWDEEVGPVIVLDRPDRQDHPFDPDSFVAVDLRGVRNAAQESWVRVAVKHAADPAADFSQRTLVTGGGGLVYVYLDAAATGAVVSATGPDGAASPDKVSFTAAEWQAARSAAVGDVALTKTFRVNRVAVGNPAAPKTMSSSGSYTVTSTLKPRHTAGSFPVRIYKYRYVAGKWRSYGYVKAKAADYRSYTRCSCKVKLPSKGKWRLRAYAPADAFHKATWSRGYDYVSVR